MFVCVPEKKTLDPLELELQVIVSLDMGARNHIQVFNQNALLSAESVL